MTIAIADLSSEMIESKPVEYDWGEEGWEWGVVYPDFSDWTIQDCVDVADEHGWDIAEVVDAGAGAVNWQGLLRAHISNEPDFGCPMMNYYYPLPDTLDTEKAQALLLNTCLVVVMVRVDTDADEFPAMALTGDGMDLTWEICEAYITLGFLPPVHFCGLVRMAGRGASERDKGTIAACRRSLEVIGHWNTQKAQALNTIEEEAS